MSTPLQQVYVLYEEYPHEGCSEPLSVHSTLASAMAAADNTGSPRAGEPRSEWQPYAPLFGEGVVGVDRQTKYGTQNIIEMEVQ